MTLDAPRLGPDELRDRPGRRAVRRSEVAMRGAVWNVHRDEVELDDGPATREYVHHTGAVAVLAVREDRGAPEIFVIRQYRHPIGTEDWEIPAGLLDVEGEPPEEAARRELAEEADLRAEHWEPLVSFTPSPGGLDETIHTFVATGLSDVPVGERHAREGEEAGMPSGWVTLADAVRAVLGGQVHNGPLMLSVLALARRLERG
ncbi:ADP-ribose pyrophosphatase [Serinicoccus sp. CUA-874]|uniref:NUDIX domain-containing protein n=1 Tax=Serinicoccus sp. CUA-874 TaxID=1517939 RepID=UPI0009647C21|nr:NUDIX hydrolase [Serinicoccus sp. CUA-874]OLT18557.1 ADP-ribose pyrophosphatase [Serinicoccus sp. CUA-874]